MSFGDDFVQRVALIGDTASGKTCFISVLRWMGEPNDYPFENEGANGKSKAYLDSLFKTFNQGELPKGSDRETELEFSEKYVPVAGEKVRFNFCLRDFKGGDLEYLDRESPLLQTWAGCDVLLVLLDIGKVLTGGQDLIENLHNLASVLTRPEMQSKGKRLAIILTQADKGGYTLENHSEDEAKRFMEATSCLKGILGIGKEFADCRCFLLASLGLTPAKDESGIARLQMGEHGPILKPFGYEELFNWLSDVKRKQIIDEVVGTVTRKSKPYLVIGTMIGFAALVLGGVVSYKYTEATRIYDGVNSTVEEKAAATWKMRPKDLASSIEARIQEYEAELKKEGVDESKAKRVVDRGEPFWSKAKLSEEQRKRVDEITQEAKRCWEDQLVARIKELVENSRDEYARGEIDHYNGDSFILKSRQQEVDEAIRTLQQRQIRSQKGDIDRCLVNDLAGMKHKLDLIRLFPFDSEQDKHDAHNAVTAVQTLMENGSFKITQIQAGSLFKHRDIYVMVASGVGSGADLRTLKEKQGIDGFQTDLQKNRTQLHWQGNGNSLVSWRPGTRLRVELRRDSFWSDKAIAVIERKGDWLDFLELLQPKKEMNSVNYGNFNGSPWIWMACEEFPNPEQTLKLVEKYVIPGDYWKDGE